MIFQNYTWSCGATALVNAAIALGVHNITEEKAIAAAGSNPEGTNVEDLQKAFTTLELDHEEYASEHIGQSWDWLRGCLLAGYPVLLCLDNWDHWITAIGITGPSVVYVDPDGYDRGVRTENGVFVVEKTELMNRWCHETEDKQCYGIKVIYV